MRFLCLHGMGTSGAIFSIQTSAFRSKLDPEKYVFDFVDAPFESAPSAGVDAFFPPPNYTFWRGIDPTDVKGAHEWLLTLLDRQGPYDGVVCFSQGCALISSFILYHNNERPEEPLPFKAAIFICGGIPLGVISDLGLPVSAEAWEINERTGRELHEKAGAAAAEIQAIMEGGRDARKGLWDRTDTLDHDPLAEFPTDRTNVFGLDYTRFPDTLKITIPTVHIYGSKDPRYPSSMQLIHFSEEGKRRIYDHAGGHDIPRTTVVSDKIAELVKWLEVMLTE
ncbi:MAG: hypothetical protein M1830_002377 [Pleopsidium flavum]|nr:MAG: hypothetical protein M1830_002377 [Pleopsidium flavum]